MAYLDPEKAFEHFRDRTLEGIQLHFPLKGKVQTLLLDKLEVRDDQHPDDLRAQHAAKISGGNFSVPVFGHMRLIDNATGRVVDQRKMRLAEIPRMTQRYSYILEGNEFQVDNQWQLKPGAYTRRRQNGELETRFNVVNKSAFDMVFDPGSHQFHLEYNKASLPVYPLLKALGVDDDTLEKELGKDVVHANRTARGVAGTLEKFYKTDKRADAPSKEEAVKHFYETMAASTMRPDATNITLGKPFDHVNGEALLLAAKKLLKVQGGAAEDDRDSLIFKDLRSAGDFVYDKMKGAGKTILIKTGRKLNTATDIRDVLKFDLFNEPVRQSFKKNSAVRIATQINPVEMVSSALQTTIMGPGGIQSERQVTDEAKFVNPTHMGYLDPIHTPEGSRTGVSLRLPIGIHKVGSEPCIPLYNMKTEKVELVPPGAFSVSKVVLPDQITWKAGKPVAIGHTVKMAGGNNNEIIDGKLSEAHYVMRHPSQLLNMTSNLIPFLGNTSGNRASMATRHIEQSISLVHRDAPLVQVSTGVDKAGMDSFEQVLGRQASHQAPHAGVVKQIKDDAIVIAGIDGKMHEVQIYNNYPLNDAKSVLHSTPIVKVGDKVHAHQTVADTNYSKNGVLALGTNLRVGYLPFKGYNFEDGVVISDTAAKKLSSVHLYKEAVPVDVDTTVNKRSFLLHHPGAYKTAQLGHIGDNGLPKIGSIVQPGDPLVLAIKPFTLKDRVGETAIRKSLTGSHTDRSLKWGGESSGEVVGVSHDKDGVHVHVRTVEIMQVGDKLAGRYGNKGIVTMVLPDKEMPHTKDGRPIEVALNPSGVPGRMNVGQVLETAASKLARKMGHPFIVPSFQKHADMVAHVQAELKKHNLSDVEELHDPVTGQNLGEALVGEQHILKLVHQVDKKVAVSSGMSTEHNPATYDINLQPKHGQRIGALGMYAMLAHGARANLREMQTWKGEGPDDASKAESKRWQSQHNDVWKAIQTGSAFPTPKAPFAFTKFESLLKGAGVNLEKHGHHMVLSPLTDKHILALTEHRVLTKPGERLEAKVNKDTGELKSRPGGLFDEKLTGGHGGMKWSRIDLAEPLPNPVFEAPIRVLTGLKEKEFKALLAGEQGINAQGKLGDLGAGMMTGGTAIKHLLSKVDVAKELKHGLAELKVTSASKVNAVLKRVKYLQALDHLGMKAEDAYIIHHVPVIPPAMRPASLMQDGNIKYADINQLYSGLGLINEQLKDPVLVKNFTEQRKSELRRNLYDGLQAITGFGVPYANQKHKGLLHTLAGANPKTGFFQNTLVQKRQDLTMRSTIVPEPALGLNEVGLPRAHAIDLFRPFIVKKLQEMGAAPTPLDAQKMLLKPDTVTVRTALDKVMAERPVLLKRDPALHKYSVQGFQAKVVEGNAIKIHPLVTGGFNADFDGDTMSVFVPISREAVAEAHRMKPTNNLFSESSGRIAFVPTLESALGVYKLSLVGKKSGRSFKNPGEVLDSVRHGHVGYTDVVSLNGKHTTPGRVMLASTMPEAMQSDLLHNLEAKIDKKGLDTLLMTLGKNHKDEFDHSVNALKDLGNGAAYGSITVPLAHSSVANLTDPKKNVFIPIGTHSLSLKDFEVDKTARALVLDAAHAKVDKVNALGLNQAEHDRRVVDIYNTADKELRANHELKMDEHPTNLFTMYRAGVKPGWDQYKQMLVAPMLLKDSADRTIPTPVMKSYSEGLDVAGYWTQMHGARRGSVLKVQEVQDPGYMSKLLMNNTMNMLIGSHDCGTQRGILMGVHDDDINDRVLVHTYKNGDLHIKAGTLITPSIVDQVQHADKHAKLLVRSPLKCEHEHGICQKCAGLNSDGKFHETGTNIGVLATHTVGERAVQLTLKSFHTGGVVEQGGGKLLNSFARFEQLTMLPKTIPNAASLAMTSGTVDKVEHTPTGVNVTIGGHRHFVGKDDAGNALHQPLGKSDWSGIRVGTELKAGGLLSDPTRTYVNPHDLYKATGSIDRVQNAMASEIYGLYKDEGIKRRHVETVVKAMSNLTKVVHPGDSEGVLRGEFQPLSVVQHVNAELVKAGRRPIEHTPVLKGVNMLPLEAQDDWMAKLQHQKLRDTVARAAALGEHSNLHGAHPIPGLAYGAQFGLTAKDSMKPGLHHLRDVPDSNY